jgi:hypothetical protein
MCGGDLEPMGVRRARFAKTSNIIAIGEDDA